MKNIPVRGIRNNNPFNIKRSYIEWQGEDKVPNVFDPTFEQFKCMKFGIRAGIVLLNNYIKNGYDTPRKIINRFAPTSENNVGNYLSFVVRNSRSILFISPDEPVSTISQFCTMCSRMVTYECNLNYNQLVNFRLLPSDFKNWYRMFVSNSKLIDDYE